MADEASGKTLDITLLVLADELIDMVLSYSFIDHRDLCRCAKVCKRLNVIATGNELWKKKALSRYCTGVSILDGYYNSKTKSFTLSLIGGTFGRQFQMKTG